MASSQANKWGGLSAMLSAVLMLIWVITTLMDYDLFAAFVPAALLLLFLSLPAMRSSQGGKDGTLGKIGHWILMIWGSAFLLMFLAAMAIELFTEEVPETFAPAIFEGPVIAVVLVGLLLGILLFSIATIIAGVIPRLAALFFLLGLPIGIALDAFVFKVSDDESGPGFFIGIPMFAIGIAWIGWWIWSGKGAGSLSSGVNAE